MKAPREVTRVVLQRVKIGCRVDVAPVVLDSMEMDHILDYMTERLTFVFKAYIWAGKRHVTRRTIYEPTDWWQHVRKRWLPNWWLRRWPVRTHPRVIETSYQHVCPHLNLYPPGRYGGCDENTHIEFLSQTPYEGEYKLEGEES